MAYDHAFQYERNIFEEISVAVDNIFTAYVTKPNIQQPLFTSYCDGKRTRCQTGLSQWGSKDLGDQGYAALDILKNYYGTDIVLQSAEKVEGVLVPFHGTVVASVSSGEDVRTVQSQLNKVAGHYPKIPLLRVDRLYEEQTQNAVEAFQEIFHLLVSGRRPRRTHRYLNPRGLKKAACRRRTGGLFSPRFKSPLVRMSGMDISISVAWPATGHASISGAISSV